MKIASVIKFGGTPNDLVWMYNDDQFNATSQLIVDETHQALLVVNGQAADLFGAGRHTLSVPNIPILKKIISIPTDGVSPFVCKVFYISQVHQMDMKWGTQGAIALNDPLYNIFMHVMLHGSMTFSVVDARKFLIKLAGFRRFTSADLVSSFRGIISSHVKDCISKIMINGKLSYFMINANLFDVSAAVKERLDTIFDEYGIRIEYFNIETIEVPDKDYAGLSQAKERAASRLAEGYTWEDERRMMIAETFAGNEGTMGNMGGLVGGMMVGGLYGGTIADIARQALQNNPVAQAMSGVAVDGTSQGFDTAAFFAGTQAHGQSVSQAAPQGAPQAEPAPVSQPPVGKFCAQCGASLVHNARFCAQCGTPQETKPVCPACSQELASGSKFCPYCGTKM